MTGGFADWSVCGSLFRQEYLFRKLFHVNDLRQRTKIVDELPGGASPAAIAYRWVSWVVSLVVGLVAPILLGWWLDQSIGVQPGFTLGGVLLGLALAGLRLWQLAKSTAGQSATKQASQRRSPDEGS